jgi:hypothetical protein
MKGTNLVDVLRRLDAPTVTCNEYVLDEYVQLVYYEYDVLEYELSSKRALVSVSVAVASS